MFYLIQHGSYLAYIKADGRAVWSPHKAHRHYFVTKAEADHAGNRFGGRTVRVK